jgi:hypothetical protein
MLVIKGQPLIIVVETVGIRFREMPHARDVGGGQDDAAKNITPRPDRDRVDERFGALDCSVEAAKIVRGRRVEELFSDCEIVRRTRSSSKHYERHRGSCAQTLLLGDRPARSLGAQDASSLDELLNRGLIFSAGLQQIDSNRVSDRNLGVRRVGVELLES